MIVISLKCIIYQSFDKIVILSRYAIAITNFWNDSYSYNYLMVKNILLNQFFIERNGIVNQRQNIRRGESNQYQNLSHIKLQKKKQTIN